MTTNPTNINLQKTVKPYCQADSKRSWIQIANTIIPLFIAYIVAFNVYDIHWALALPFSILAGLLTTRTFIIMHDCGHGSFFKNRKLRDTVGVITGILAFTPYHQWTREHAAHHQHSGNLDHRGRGDVWTMTLAEYEKAGFLDRLKYQLYRNPLVTFGIGPIFLFQFRHRFTLKTDRALEKRNVYFTNIVLTLILGTLIATMGWTKVLIVLGASVCSAQLLGCLLFYVQHQYDEVYWSKGQEWDYNTAALEGCSYLKLPKVFQWFTGNIGFHHIHHLNHKVPNYKLEECHRDNGVFHNVVTLSFSDIWHCIFLKIYNEESGRMMTWREVRAYEKTHAVSQAAA